MWSLGCVLYVLLTGALPFDGANDFEVIPKIRKGEFQQSPFLNGNNMHELITCMLNPDPKKRANLEDIQKHPWAWSDKSMVAMLVRPFANALASRRRALLGEDSEGSGSDKERHTPSVPRRNTFSTGRVNRDTEIKDGGPLSKGQLAALNLESTNSKRSSLKRQLSYFSDSELSAGSGSRKPQEGRKRKMSSAAAVSQKVVKARELLGDEGDAEQDVMDTPSPRKSFTKGEGQKRAVRTRRRGGNESDVSVSENLSDAEMNDGDNGIHNGEAHEHNSDDERLRVLKDMDAEDDMTTTTTTTTTTSEEMKIEKQKKSGLPERASTKKKKAKMRLKMLEEQMDQEVKPKRAKKSKKAAVRINSEGAGDEDLSNRPSRSYSVQDRKPVIIMTAKESMKESQTKVWATPLTKNLNLSLLT